ncbi:MAG TPA: DNA polymerase III subunit [Firmicutes bacterium]|nr:DNA polymerase III subunit [Bacillota bacterium]
MKAPDDLGQGCDRIKQIFSGQKLSHAYLFLGPGGRRKEAFVRELASRALCLAEGGASPCGQCRSCHLFSSGNHPDFRMIRPAGDKIKIEHIREVCRDAAYLPYLSKRKIYFFTELDKLTEVAANAFLKTLEEPPAGVIFLAMAPGEDRVLPTILSRMQRCYVSFAEEGSDPEQVGAEKDDPTVIEGFSGWKSILDLFHLAEYWEKQDRTLIDRHLLNLCEEFRRRMLAEPDNSAYPRIIGEIGEAREHLASNVNTRLLLEDLYLRIYEASFATGHSTEGLVVKMRPES